MCLHRPRRRVDSVLELCDPDVLRDEESSEQACLPTLLEGGRTSADLSPSCTGRGLRKGCSPSFGLSGAVVIPAAEVDDVIEGARAVEAEDEGYRSEIRREQLPRPRGDD